jgi:hypothetical protein
LAKDEVLLMKGNGGNHGEEKRKEKGQEEKEEGQEVGLVRDNWTDDTPATMAGVIYLSVKE